MVLFVLVVVVVVAVAAVAVVAAVTVVAVAVPLRPTCLHQLRVRVRLLDGGEPAVPAAGAFRAFWKVGVVGSPAARDLLRVAAWQLAARVDDALLHGELPSLVLEEQPDSLCPWSVHVLVQERKPRPPDADALLVGAPVHQKQDLLPPVGRPAALLRQPRAVRVKDAVHQLEESLGLSQAECAVLECRDEF